MHTHTHTLMMMPNLGLHDCALRSCGHTSLPISAALPRTSRHRLCSRPRPWRFSCQVTIKTDFWCTCRRCSSSPLPHHHLRVSRGKLSLCCAAPVWTWEGLSSVFVPETSSEMRKSEHVCSVFNELKSNFMFHRSLVKPRLFYPEMLLIFT